MTGLMEAMRSSLVTCRDTLQLPRKLLLSSSCGSHSGIVACIKLSAARQEGNHSHGQAGSTHLDHWSCWCACHAHDTRRVVSKTGLYDSTSSVKTFTVDSTYVLVPSRLQRRRSTDHEQPIVFDILLVCRPDWLCSCTTGCPGGSPRARPASHPAPAGHSSCSSVTRGRANGAHRLRLPSSAG